MTDSSTDWRSWLGTLTILFGILLFASHANELMTQVVIAPGTAADTGTVADCRPDELEEEGLSLEECQLMVTSVQIRLASQSTWFRSTQIILASIGTIAAVFSIMIGIALVGSKAQAIKPAVFIFALLVIIDLASFIAASSSGPLLRAIYLEKLLLWFFLHLSLLLASASRLTTRVSGEVGFDRGDT
jgi:hypothetical protein